MEPNGQTTIADILGTSAPAAAPQTQADPGQVATPPMQTQEPPVATPPVDPALATPPATPEVKPIPQVPVPVLQEERQRRQNAEEQNRWLQEQLRQLVDAQQRAQQPQPQPIDPIANPEAAYFALQQQNHDLVRQMQSMSVNQRADFSEMLARDRHGDATVNEAVESARAAGLGRHFMNSPDPYKELINWHSSQKIAKEVGTDPNAYRQRIEAEVRAKILAEMKAGTPPPRNLPPSLATATKAANGTDFVQDAGDFFRTSLMNRKG